MQTSIALLPVLVALVASGCTRAVRGSWPSGEPRYSGAVSRGRDLAQGEWVFWYENGAKQAEGDFEDGAVVGPADLGPSATRIPRGGRELYWTFWDDGGRMSAEGQYSHGLRDGLWACWYENGNPCCTGHFEAGLAEGYHVTWYPDLTKHDTRNYAAGWLHGERIVRNRAGRIVWRGEYVDGELVASAPRDAVEPPIHDVEGCADRAEVGLPRSIEIAQRGP